MKLCLIDVETTGVDPKVNGIIQIAGRIIVAEPQFEVVETFNLFCNVLPGDKIESRALEANHMTLEQVAAFPPASQAHAELLRILGKHCDKFNKMDKLWFAAYNARFDYDFMRGWFEKLGDKYFGSWFWFPYLDVMNMAAFDLIDKRAGMENFKLASVAAAYGLTASSELHDASTDVELTQRIFEKLL